jgi:hypothetical protein
MANATLGSLNPCIDPVANGSALHEDNGVMPVLSGDGRRQANDISRLGSPSNKLEACSGQMVAFIDNQMASTYFPL